MWVVIVVVVALCRWFVWLLIVVVSDANFLYSLSSNFFIVFVRYLSVMSGF